MFPENRFMELLIIGALALIVIGPKDLPILMRRVGQFMGKVRGMAAEFRASFDELARQSELDELRREVEALRQGTNLTGEADKTAGADAGGVLDEIKNNMSLRMTPAMTPLPPPEVVAPAEPAAQPEPPAAESAQKPKRAPRKAATRASGPAA
jgi:sec-independent protein translocase protein TatB